MPAPLPLVSVTIPAGQSLSGIANCTAGSLRSIITPPAWDYSGGLSFQVSNDGINFFDLFTAGREYMTMPVVPNVCNIVVQSGDLGWIPYVILRSGSRQTPVPQSADRIFQIILMK